MFSTVTRSSLLIISELIYPGTFFSIIVVSFGSKTVEKNSNSLDDGTQPTTRGELVERKYDKWKEWGNRVN